MAGLFRVLRAAPLRYLVAWLAPLLDGLARAWIRTKREVLPDSRDLVPTLAWDVYKDAAPNHRERLYRFFEEWYRDHPDEFERVVADVIRDTSIDGRRRIYATVQAAAATTDQEGEAAARAFAQATGATNDALAKSLAEPLTRDASCARLVSVVNEALSVASPRLKQSFFEWAEDRAASDEHALAYAEQNFERITRDIERHKGPLAGLRILELGPGHLLATGILFYVHGAESYTAIDYFPIAGKDSSLYARLRRHLAGGPRLVPSPPAAREEALRRFDAAVKLDGPEVALDEKKVVCRYPVDAAKLPFPDASFDVVFSMASFEHFTDPVAAVRECARVTAPGGLGLHQIDLRDHRDFSKPLDFLRYDEDAWRKLFVAVPFAFTNRARKSDFERAFSEAGLAPERVDVTMKAPFDEAQRAQLDARFRDRPAADLEALSAFFVVKKAQRTATG